MRTFIAGLLGGLTLFVWGMLAHTVLPLGEAGMRQSKSEDAVIAVLQENMPATGVYMVPGLSAEQMADDAAVKAYQEKAPTVPNAMIFYQENGRDGTQMGRNLLAEYLCNTLAALLVAIILALAPLSKARRILLSGGLGVFAWLSVSAPYWNWYRFPQEFSLANLAMLVLGWLLSGAVMAWWLARTGK